MSLSAILEKAIYQWIMQHFGESEAENPCYAIRPLAQYLASVVKKYQ